MSAEAVEVLYLLGCADQIAGVTGFAVEPPAVRRKPRVSGFSSVNFDKIAALKPDLIVTFSDVQADATRELLRRGFTVLATNQRSLAEIFEAILLLGRVVGRATEAHQLIEKLREEVFRKTNHEALRPKVYFEEWDEPLISGIRWVGELIEAAGGADIFADLSVSSRAPDRVVSSEEIIRRQPEIIIASWCGKKVDLETICQRPGWNNIPAVQNRHVHELKSSYILQPGPSLLKGLRELRQIIDSWRGGNLR